MIFFEDTTSSIALRLQETFRSFDDDNDGEINECEFTQAWLWLGFRGEEVEIHEIFRTVDADSRDLINEQDFLQIITSEGHPELQIKANLGVMDERPALVEKRFNAMSSTSIGRQLLQREMDSDVEKKVEGVIDILSAMTSAVPEMGQKQQLYMNILSTFQSCNTNGNGQLNIDQYKQAWKRNLGHYFGQIILERLIKARLE